MYTNYVSELDNKNTLDNFNWTIRLETKSFRIS